ncbi:UDP-N-acetylmuramoyl-tripeptide--D-alanyl-D-alanine ligase [Akkermansiaceae bacterium]|jgi:UDP-N-acetylmuramoyl-tripeptide--D-alanyl-D-alanine ligase|nr:UDP-N-acetylmuramoyl-tripeptide--D-alanyl-D-alanine ligase [Verrucomicrobiota bacterium]MDA7504703.1 UDP-N-acetylmuramoyl-tripeptide--D-alanyl-D-alanine ligase [Akkermansiaceae bacterium]MDB4656323.1 UDP-N-acetylmuramoyl-tripeptide--D-alanyl-D-alanine ligase [bacterium]MDA7515859.1 UDP-N-acetylmuramoyl-tripeptide--D-alanyl-D-alanine ligase [Akkermansiaceae bacterium]MDA7539082.1 UDP-N-acetylmuramoyl-tripeptide--D-alanyl-D-alanine ligase [Akkermansiaceae bacterium]
MKSYPLQKLAHAMSGSLLQGGEDCVISAGVSTDTRCLPAGAMFFALKGENFDAHHFLAEAVEAGAGALVLQDDSDLPEGIPVILVNDTLKALQALAKWYRGELGIPVVAITGSNGKTSTKDYTHSVLSQKFRVNSTLGNLNNHIGLPLTVLATAADDEVGVFEMGMNHSGELAPLCEIGRPDVSIITNVGTAHIEHLGSRKAIAIEKGTVARVLSEKGTLLLPSDCDEAYDFRASTPARVITVGDGEIRAENTVSGESGSAFDLTIDGLGTKRTSISIVGRHMISNALLAAGAGYVLGLSLDEISAGLTNAKLTSGRLRRYLSHGLTVIDDTYNANPESVIAALETLASLPGSGRRIAALGMMAELGEHAVEAYPRIGRIARDLGVTLITVGDDADKYGDDHHFRNHEEAATWLSNETSPGDIVLFKGSRMAAMDQVMKLTFPE